MGCKRKIAAAVLALLSLPAWPAAPITPIEHLVVIVGENRSFDHLFATYTPRPGQTIANLLSRGIVNADGSPGANFAAATQMIGRNPGVYRATPEIVGPYPFLPSPFAVGAPGQRDDAPDARLPARLGNGPYPIGRYVGYGPHTGDPVHRFFQMWQQINGGDKNLFVWVAETAGAGPDNEPSPLPCATRQGGVAMGFYNMAAGDAPYFRELADRFALADNYHQPVMGGTTANYFSLITGDVGVYRRNGRNAAPPAKLIENPDARPGTDNRYRVDGFQGGSYVHCADTQAPGVAGIREVLARLPYRAFNDGNCEPGAYYMVNNLEPAYRADGKLQRQAAGKLYLPPQSVPHIGDALSRAGVSWRWYSGGRNDGRRTSEYCTVCDTPTYFKSTMTGPDIAKLVDLQQFYGDVDNNRLPAVAVVSPYDSVSGHPGYAMPTGFEQLVRGLVERVQRNEDLWRKTAIFVTFDEGGGYYDSGYIQLIDFFGDGTRVPFIAVSPYARRGVVDHTYFDHASVLKFIERNWQLPPLSKRSRDNLPNPVHDEQDPYVPRNRPAIGDLFNLFDFQSEPVKHGGQ